MDKVTVIGFQHSGKTCYLTGMYDTMSMGVKNFSLVEKNPDQDWYLQNLWEKISYGSTRSWPLSTDEKRTYSFSLCHCFNKIMEFEWLDYPGGALIDPGYNLIEDIKNQLSESACLLVLVNGASFAYEGDPKDKKEIQAANLDEYKRIVSKNLKKNNDLEAVRQLTKIGAEDVELPPIGIVVTKADLIKDKWAPHVQEIIRDNFEPIFGEGGEDDRIVMLAAVTLGYDIEKGADADPEDIELPIAFAVLSILRKYIIAARILKANSQAELSEKDAKILKIFNKKELERLREEIKKLDAIIGKLSRDAIRLLDLFGENKPIYINGEKQNFCKYYRDQLKMS